MGKANTAVNTWLSDNRRFADLFNGTVFGGKQVILPEDLNGLDRKTDRIFPVITLVFYYDLKKWDGAVELYDMFHFDSRTDTETEIFNLLRTYLPNYRINLIDAGNMENINRFRTDLQQIFGVLQYRGKKEELRSYMLENRDYFGQVDVETYHALQSFLHSEKIMKEVEVSQGKERIDMCQALEDIYADGVKDGEKTGRTQEKLAIIVKMMQDNLPISTIKKYTDATDEEIENAKTAVLH